MPGRRPGGREREDGRRPAGPAWVDGFARRSGRWLPSRSSRPRRARVILAAACAAILVAIFALVATLPGSTAGRRTSRFARSANGAAPAAPTTTAAPPVTAVPAPPSSSAASASSAPPPAPTPSVSSASAPSMSPPPPGGFFKLVPPGGWGSLHSGGLCRPLVHSSTWEPRPDNSKRNHVMPDPRAVHAAFVDRPRAVDGAQDARWDTWLLPRVDGQFTGTTDEIFQWGACKWGLPDDLLRAIAVRESTWYQYETYPSGRCVPNFGCGDTFKKTSSTSRAFCAALARRGYDYQRDLGPGNCPKTFSIVGVMSWQDPQWGAWPEDQNGTFPFNRDSTAFAVDYLASQLRGCYEGWESWLDGTGKGRYAVGDLWGCVGAWYAGDWHSDAADGYISRVRHELDTRPWLDPDWPHVKPECSPSYGCPGPDPL